MTRRAILRWLIVAFLVVQLALPILALGGPRPTGFGWQMFTAYAPAPIVTVEMTDGSARSIELGELLAHPRPEADLVTAIVAELCGRDGVVAVTVQETDEHHRVSCP